MALFLLKRCGGGASSSLVEAQAASRPGGNSTTDSLVRDLEVRVRSSSEPHMGCPRQQCAHTRDSIHSPLHFCFPVASLTTNSPTNLGKCSYLTQLGASRSHLPQLPGRALFVFYICTLSVFYICLLPSSSSSALRHSHATRLTHHVALGHRWHNNHTEPRHHDPTFFRLLSSRRVKRSREAADLGFASRTAEDDR